jgi:hypothetical protein
MKTKEQAYTDYCRENPTEKVVYKDFMAGYETATPKWIKVEDGLPEDDRTVVCYVVNKAKSEWSEPKLGSYINGNWYCKDGRYSHEIVTKWQEIAK